MPDIFLSYSRDDQAVARRFAQALKEEGFEVWWDQALHSGDPYDRITEQALKDAKAVVVLWSRSSVESRWVRAEATIADRHRILVPVMIEDCDRPLMFELTQAPDFSRWKGDTGSPLWREFVGDVRRYVSGGTGGRGGAVTPARHAGGFTHRRRWLAIAATVLVLGGTAALLWNPEPRSDAAPRRAAAADARSRASIAVLPFVDMTAERLDQPLAEGLAEEISNWLAQIPQFNVVARSSAFMFGGPRQDVREVGRALGATHVLEGSVRRGGAVVRVTVQLVAVADGYHLWSKTFDMPDGNPLRIEDAVSRAVAEALDARLSEETERRWNARLAREPRSYELYLRARYEQGQRTAGHNLRAMELYRRAIAEDAGFVLAYVGLAESLLNSVPLNDRTMAEVAPEVTTLLDEVDRRSPQLPEALAARGWLALDEYRTSDALELMQRAIALNPNDAATHSRLGNLYAKMAQPRLAAERYDVAASLNPLDFITYLNKCLALQDLAEYVAAESACAKARELDTASPWGPLASAWLEYSRGNLRASLDWLDRAVSVAPDFLALQAHRVPILLQLGQYSQAQAAAAGLPAQAEVERSYLQAMIALSREDAEALNSKLELIGRHAAALDETQLLELAHLQLAAGNSIAASQALDQARQAPSWRAASLVDPDYVRLAYAAAVIVAGVELASGDRAAATSTLDALDDMLDRFEAGGAACSGLYLLRAESHALRGQADAAMDALRTAVDRGWRASRSARTDPILRDLRERSDFRQLMAHVDVLSLADSADTRASVP